MEQELAIRLNENDAVEIIDERENNQEQVFLRHPMFKVKDLIKTIQCRLLNISLNQFHENDERINHRKKWITGGINCELLQLGSQQWKKGKLRVNVTVEFIPDEVESPLDDVRQGSNQNES
jgi:hypothetical protein